MVCKRNGDTMELCEEIEKKCLSLSHFDLQVCPV